MNLIRSSRFGRFLSIAVVAIMLTGLIPYGITDARAEQGARTILLFRVSDKSSANISGLDRLATDALQMHIDQRDGMECTEFAENSPLVRRALSEGRILSTQVQTGPADARDAIEIGHGLKVDAVVLASVQLYRRTTNPRMVETIMAGRAYDVEKNYDEEKGAAVQKPQVNKALGIVGKSRKMPGYTGSERPLAREAINQATYNLAQVMAGRKMSEVANKRPKKKDENKTEKILAYLALFGLALWAVSESGGGREVGPSPKAKPPEPDALQVIGGDPVNGIHITWRQPTGTSFTLLRYEIQRSVEGGVFSYFGTGNASNDVDPADNSFDDYDVEDGKQYRYRIRAVYQNSKFSRWVSFETIAP